MPEDLASNMGFIMGTKHRERVVQVLGSKGKLSAEKVAKIRAHSGTIRQEDPGRYGGEKPRLRE